MLDEIAVPGGPGSRVQIPRCVFLPPVPTKREQWPNNVIQCDLSMAGSATETKAAISMETDSLAEIHQFRAGAIYGLASIVARVSDSGELTPAKELGYNNHNGSPWF